MRLLLKPIVLTYTVLSCFLISCTANQGKTLEKFPEVYSKAAIGAFPLVSSQQCAELCLAEEDYEVVNIAVNLLCDDIERVTHKKASVRKVSGLEEIGSSEALVAGTIGHSEIIDHLVSEGLIDVESIIGKWEASVIRTVKHPTTGKQIFVIAGSDRRGTAFGLMSLCRAIGVSPWYWWADVQPSHKDVLYLQRGIYLQKEPSVKYRGIFINDERFGGWAQWVEKHFDKESGKVGPKVYQKVFELLLRLKANYLWPAMHPGTQAFNADPENARLADDYAIVMGSSHCEQMLRNNEGEWKAVGTYGDFNYITNRQTMLDYWETRVKTNGKYENTYTLGLRGIHDYPMEGANTTEERVKLMQQAIDDQRDILRRNIDAPLEQIPQVLCTYEEVLDAYHSGLKVPDEVIMLWSDDKQGYTRNLSNPQECLREGGAGIYYHLSYHGDPASWIWLSPLSPAFISNELTKAYTFGARKIWVFNVGDIKPAEKEISFAMDLAWDVEKWTPANASGYIRQWAAETFGDKYADEIARIQDVYYRLMASGKDSHVWFVEYSEDEINRRISDYRDIASCAEALSEKMPQHLKDAFFELVLYPVKGAQMLNEYQLQSRLSLVYATALKEEQSLEAASRATELYDSLNSWTKYYNEELLDGKWSYFFNWRPYHWHYSDEMDAPVSSPSLIDSLRHSPVPQWVDVEKALSEGGFEIESEVDGDIDIWIKALTPVRNFSKAAADNRFCHVQCGTTEFEASATPINNIWHSPLIGPMWSKVGKVHLRKGSNVLRVTDLEQQASVKAIFAGLYPPLPEEALARVKAGEFSSKHDSAEGRINVVRQLGFNEGVVVYPFDTLSYTIESAPYVEYKIELPQGASHIDVLTLPTLRVYQGRDARYAVQVDDNPAQIFSIHEGDFTSEWRLNVLRGYALRSVPLDSSVALRHTVRVYLLDPGIVLQEIRVR